MFGLLNVYKPPDVTSRDVVNHVQRLVRPAKVGHAGTLDPLATGVLVVCVGPATRLIDFVQQMPKHYVGTFQLGCTSDTEDTEGQVVQLPSPPVPSRGDLDDVLPRFLGRIMQRPPSFSALKVQGERAYDLARRGEQVDLPPRPVTIERIEIADYAYPELTLDITCGSGTYIRSLGRDIGQALGSGAVMSALKRTAIGQFTVEQACTVEQLRGESLSDFLLPAICAVEHLERLDVDAPQVIELSYGRAIAGSIAAPATYAAAIDGDGHLVALLASAGGHRLKPARNFVAAHHAFDNR